MSTASPAAGPPPGLNLRPRRRARAALPIVLLTASCALAACGSSDPEPNGQADPPRTQSSGAPTKATPGAESLIARFKTAGIPVGKTVTYTEATDENNLLGRPGQYYAKVNWIDTRVKNGLGDFDTSDGGSLELFKSESDARKRYDYVKEVTSSASVFAEYDYLQGTVLLRLSKELTPTQTKAYEAAIKDAGS